MSIDFYYGGWIWNSASNIIWGNVADWAQVFSTMLGLLIAYKLGAHQSKLQQFEQKRDTIIRAHAICSIIGRAIDNSNLDLLNYPKLCLIIEGHEYFDKDTFHLLAEACKHIPLASLPSPVIIDSLLQIQAMLGQYMYNIEFMYTEKGKVDLAKFPEFKRAMSTIAANINNQIEVINNTHADIPRPKLLGFI